MSKKYTTAEVDYVIAGPGRTGSNLLKMILLKKYKVEHTHNAWLSTDVPVILSKRKNLFEQNISSSIGKITNEYFLYSNKFKSITLSLEQYEAAYRWNKFWYTAFEKTSNCTVYKTIFLEDVINSNHILDVDYNIEDFSQLKSPYTVDIIENYNEIKQLHEYLESTLNFEDLNLPLEDWYHEY